MLQIEHRPRRTERSAAAAARSRRRRAFRHLIYKCRSLPSEIIKVFVSGAFPRQKSICRPFAPLFPALVCCIKEERRLAEMGKYYFLQHLYVQYFYK
jgi:hypothetical protein